jgi:hypothetical protein
MIRRRTGLLTILATIVILAFAGTWWYGKNRQNPVGANILFSGELKSGSQRMGPIDVPNDVKSIKLILHCRESLVSRQLRFSV